jgi:hypothetical protein
MNIYDIEQILVRYKWVDIIEYALYNNDVMHLIKLSKHNVSK